MNIIFLTMSRIASVSDAGIYTDLMRKFRDEGHQVYIVTPYERYMHKSTSLIETEGIHILGVKTFNLRKTSLIEKGLGQVLVENQYKRAIKQYLRNISFDLILYSTPPITLMGVVAFLKELNPRSISYLLLKDIFPQNAVDLNMLSKSGIKGVLYRYFRNKERKLYKISDHIGCMSPANVKFLLENNPYVSPDKVELAPNSCQIPDLNNLSIDRVAIRRKYHLPIDVPIFIYGGNLGKPQGIPFILECMNAVKDRVDCHFVIIGNGTEYSKIEKWYKTVQPKAVSVFKSIPKEDYDKLANSCDVGLIFLDYNFTIPNYPSRLLSYLLARKPIVAATDINSDIGYIAEINGYGLWCPSNSVSSFENCIDKIISSNIRLMGEKGYQFFLNNYTIDHTYNAIMQHITYK